MAEVARRILADAGLRAVDGTGARLQHELRDFISLRLRLVRTTPARATDGPMDILELERMQQRLGEIFERLWPADPGVASQPIEMRFGRAGLFLGRDVAPGSSNT